MSKRFNKFILAIAGLLMVVLVSGCAGNKTVATLKGGKITQDELYQEMKSSSVGRQTLQTMIISKALDDQYGKFVSDKEVNKSFNTYKSQYGKQFDQILSQNGMTQKSFKQSIKTNLLTKVAVKKLEKISNADLKKQWKSYSPKITVEHILVDKKETAQSIIDKLNKGEDFKKLAKAESTDPGTKSKGGLMPAFAKNDSSIDKDFRTASFKLSKVGDYTSEPVKSAYGYHVIKLVKKPAKGQMKDHTKELKKEIYAAKMQDSTTMQKVITKVLKKADVSIKDNDLKDVLANYVSSSKSSK